jgi:putative oxidoreductase
MIHVSIASLVLRLGMSIPMMTHGWPKVVRAWEGNWKFGDPLGLGEPVTLALAIFSEFICSLLLIIGFKTRFFALFPAFTMVVATFIVHVDDPWKKQELPILFLIGFLAICLLGGGRYSLDGKLISRR